MPRYLTVIIEKYMYWTVAKYKYDVLDMLAFARDYCVKPYLSETSIIRTEKSLGLKLKVFHRKPKLSPFLTQLKFVPPPAH